MNNILIRISQIQETKATHFLILKFILEKTTKDYKLGL